MKARLTVCKANILIQYHFAFEKFPLKSVYLINIKLSLKYEKKKHEKYVGGAIVLLFGDDEMS